MSLIAPFPYQGGKRRSAVEVWREFGNVEVYAEPFAGSLAVLLHREKPCGREVVCDKDGHIANFWRAMQADPEAVAQHADYPTFHHDLTARHRYLVAWGAANSNRLTEDPEFYDARCAGWWAWGKSNWIGGGWCATGENLLCAQSVGTQVPQMRYCISGNGVNAQRVGIPYIGANNWRVGQGVQAQRQGKNLPAVSTARAAIGSGAQRTQHRHSLQQQR